MRAGFDMMVMALTGEMPGAVACRRSEKLTKTTKTA